MIVVVSDLHLSEGRRQRTRKLSPNEDFFFDEAFTRFLENLDNKSSEPVHLLINGDFFDFLQVPIYMEDIAKWEHLAQLSPREKAYICKYGAKTDEQSTILKLEKIAGGHSVFFDGLGRFVAAGNRLTVIMGNHDVELFWPGVQRRFRELLRAEEFATVSADGGSLESSVEFAPWIYYDREYALYAEHGNQYEAANSFSHWLYPVLPKKNTEINLPVGSLFVRYLLNRIEQINPFADNIKPNTKYVAWALKNNPLGFRHQLRLLGQFIFALAKSYRKTGKLAKYGAADLVEFREETDDRIKKISTRYDIVSNLPLSEHPLRKILNLHKLPINESKGRFLGQAFVAYLDVWSFLIGAGAAVLFVASVLVLGFSSVMAAISLAVSVLGLIAGNLFFSVGSAISAENLRVVNKISRILNESGNPVRYVTFGHTHEPEIFKTESDTLYFNTGTWGVIFNDQEELIREKKQFAAMVIDEPGQEPHLVRWNDGIGSLEPLPLFDSH